jgi:peptidoglycan hydrolase-like protein with peptidoglycan-binding domain
MKIRFLLLLLALPLLLIQAANADDQLRNVQSQLKSEGFYYGDINGQESPEMTAAIRRYQIRNGLEVTGALNPETLHALAGAGAASRNQPSQAPQQPAATAQRKPAPDEGDRAFLRQEEQRQPDPSHVVPPPAGPGPSDPSVVSPPAPGVTAGPGVDYGAIYASTPYFNAPREVQQETLRRAQAFLADRGFYREVVDGIPGPATEEALLSFQRNVRLPLTGRLDMQTLGELRLLPGRGLSNRQLQPFYPNNSGPADSYQPRRTYRGIQVD